VKILCDNNAIFHKIRRKFLSSDKKVGKVEKLCEGKIEKKNYQVIPYKSNVNLKKGESMIYLKRP
jgi:hypothetical protein